MEPTFFFHDKVITIAHWHNLQIMDLSGLLRLEHTDRFEESHEKLYGKFPTGTVNFSLVRPGTPIAGRPARVRFEELMRKQRGQALLSVIVLEERGFVASALRAVTRGLTVVSGNKTVEMVANEAAGIERALPHLCPKMEDRVARAELSLAIRCVRQHHGQAAQQAVHT